MRKLCLLIAGLMLISFLIGSLAMGATEVKVGKGDLRIGGILQAGLTYYADDDKGFDSFTLNRARFLFWGTIVPDKVKYFVQLDHKGGISVLDYKAQFFFIEKTEIAVGRFLPNFTLYMPVSTAKLEFINYPMTTTKYAVWRQVGVQTTTQTDYVDFNLGIFNGYPSNNLSDNNDAKDFLVRADIKPPVDQAQIRFGGYAWLGSGLPTFERTWTDTIPVNSEADTIYVPGSKVTTFAEETLKMNRFGGFGKVDYTKNDLTLRFRGEFLMATTEKLYFADMDSVSEMESQAYFGQASVQPVPQVEFLVRYEAWDPNTDSDAKHDDVTAITGGVNYYLEGLNSMFYLNYIHKIQDVKKTAQTKDVEEKWESESEGIIQAQVQILF